MSSRGSSSRKKESSGAGAQRNAARVAAGGKARGRPAQAKASASESIHAQSAKWRRDHPNAPREVRPGERLTPIRTDLPYRNSDPFAAPDPHYLVTAYGEHQLGSALNDYMVDKLRQTAENVGVTRREMRSAGLKASSRADLVSAITTHVTGGRYSADFGAAKSSGAGKSSGASRSTGPATRDSLASRAATLGRQIGSAQRSGDTAKREQLINELEALIQQYRALGG